MMKYYISPPLKKVMEEHKKSLSLYRIGLKIGLSDTSLRKFLKGGGLTKESYNKVLRYYKEKYKA